MPEAFVYLQTNFSRVSGTSGREQGTDRQNLTKPNSVRNAISSGASLVKTENRDKIKI